MIYKCIFITETELMSNKTIEIIEENGSDAYRTQTEILLVTTNKNEYNAVLELLEPIENNKRLQYNHVWNFGFLNRSATYVFGRFGAFNAAVHNMGKKGSAAAQDMITIASECFGYNVSAIFAVGVACGIKNKSDIFDVLVATKISCYNYVRYGTDVDKPELKNRDTVNLPTSDFFRNYLYRPSYEYSEIVVRPGLILSGDYLINDKHFKGLVMKLEKDALGIETEGGGLFYNKPHCKIMIFKSVSDFGDRDQHEQNQCKAAQLAAEYLKKFLNDKTMRNAICRTKGKLS